jgi:secondary thiamine-phosphate synthase enzyme
MQFHQSRIQLPAMRRGCHLITEKILDSLPEIRKVQIGTLHCFLQHTSASLSINENADPDVRVDMERALDHVAPETLDYIHTIEGPDDMPAHVKSTLIGCSLQIPVSAGRLALGTWQGVYLCEHRNQATPRSIVLTLMGTESV